MVLNFGGTADILYFSARDVCQESCSCEKSTFRLLHVQKYNWREFHHLPHTCAISSGAKKGQLNKLSLGLNLSLFLTNRVLNFGGIAAYKVL